MCLSNLNAEIVACILLFRKSRHKPNLESSAKYGFPPIWGEKHGGVLSMRMQFILDSTFARLGSFPVRVGKKGEFRDWTVGPVYQNKSLTMCSSDFVFRKYEQDSAFRVSGVLQLAKRGPPVTKNFPLRRLFPSDAMMT